MHNFKGERIRIRRSWIRRQVGKNIDVTVIISGWPIEKSK